MPTSKGGGSCPAEDGLRKQLGAMNELVRIMEEQIAKCAKGQGITCPAVLVNKSASEQRQISRITFQENTGKGFSMSEPEARTEPEAPSSAASSASRGAAAPRYAAGFRTAPEERLTCDDYSESYFMRHPSMAKVCGVKLDEPQPVIEPSPAATAQ